MNKKTMVLALAAAFCANAQAEVVLYGTLMPFLDYAKTSGATAAAPADKPNQLAAAAYTGVNDPGRSRITVGTTNFGVRGEEDLGASVRLVWQLETNFQIDQNGGPGFGARNSKVGLAGGFGEFNYGMWDTPYKAMSLQISPFRAGYLFDYTPIMGNPGQGVPATTTQAGRVAGKPDAAFDRRAGNVVQYWSPKVAGLSFRLAWEVDEGAGAVAAGGPVLRPQIYSGSVYYDIGTLSIRGAYEQHKDFFGMSQLGGSAGGTAANPNSKDTAARMTVLYKIASTRIAGTVEQLKYHNDDATAGAINEYKRDAWYVLLEQQFTGGSQSIWGSYGQAADGSCSRVGGASCSTHDLGANWAAVGYIYRFSKRTEVLATYYKLTNKSSGTYSPMPAVGATVAPGADTTGAGVGIIHYF